MVRELGLERRETVRSLSTIFEKNLGKFKSVREDQTESTSGVSITILIVGWLAKLKNINNWNKFKLEMYSVQFFNNFLIDS